MYILENKKEHLYESDFAKDKIIVGNNIKHLRKYYNLTTSDLACSLGLSPSALALIERGQRSTNISNLKKLAAIFGVTIDDLLVSNCIDKLSKNKATEKLTELEALEYLRNHSNIDMGLLLIIKKIQFVLNHASSKTQRDNIIESIDAFLKALHCLLQDI